ncbi:MAG: DUF1800 domain-containing protein [Candidatus Binatia bacterium]|nr:DUF1800 domain-containing protein [Candidatus Binatia bacterium]
MVVWDEENVVHLLNRAGFGAKPSDVSKFVKKGQAFTVEFLVGQKASKAKGPGKSSNDRAELRKLSTWWCKRMEKQNARRLQEKMVLLWHDHFATQFDVVKNVRQMSFQNRAFRQFGMGDMRTLIHEVTRDAAMLDFLDGKTNKDGSLNENFGREVLELFVLGVFSFDGTEENYTQDDVIAVTRATTGFQISDKDIGYFNPNRFDEDPKTLFAGKSFEVTANFGVEDGSDNLLPPATNVIDAIFTHEDSSGNLTMPRFIGKKLWEYFAYPDPSAALIDSLTATFRAGGTYVISDLLRDMFLDDEFYSAQAKSSTVRNPCEFLFSAMRGLEAKSKHTYTPNALESMGMELFNPPGVNGWSNGTAWLSSGQTLARFEVGQAIAAGRDKNLVLLKPSKIIPKDATTIEEVVDEILSRLGIAGKTPTGTRAALIDYFEGETNFEDETVVETKVRGAIALALQIPESNIH